MLSWTAAVLAVLALLGAFAALIPRRPAETPTYTPFGSEVTFAKLTTDEILQSGEITAASFGEGTHVVAVNRPGSASTLLHYSADGIEWDSLELNSGDYPAYGSVVDEVFYNHGGWYVAFLKWNSANLSVINYKADKLSSGTWTNYYNTSHHAGQGLITCFDKVKDSTYGYRMVFVSSTGHFCYEKTGNTYYDCGPVFEGYDVFDIARFGKKLAVLGRDAEGAVVFFADDYESDWTMVRVPGIAPSSFVTAGSVCFIACEDGRIAYSSDLESWKFSRMPDDVDFAEFFSFGGKHYAIGEKNGKGMLYESQNGVTWERVAVVDEGLTFASVGTSAVLLYGEDGGVYRLTK